RRFQWARSYTFVWEIEVQTETRSGDLVPPNATSAEAQRLREALARIPNRTNVRLLLTITRHPELSEIRIEHQSGYWHPQIPKTLFYYQGKDYLITWDAVGEPDPPLSYERLKAVSIPEQSDLLFDKTELTGYLEKLAPAYLALSNPLKPWYFCSSGPVFETGKRTPDGFQFEGENEGKRYILQLDRFGLFKQYRLETARYTVTHRVLKTQQVAGYPIPAEVEVQEDLTSSRGRIVARLLKASPTVAAPKFAYNRGAYLEDLRLIPMEDCLEPGRSRFSHLATAYLWEGSLWSKDYLRTVVSSGSSVLPPESGRRRYSLVMFAPALLFLLLAAYLFWRGKKK
ncbi:MAG: hypothetical protein ACUVV1_10420, partial [Fimbriimonadales bacterium]